GALATGAKLDLRASTPYAEMRSEAALDALYARNAIALGRSFPDLGAAAAAFAGSTDMGNVSLALPSIHPLIGIDSLPAVPHQPEFTAAARTPAADRAVFDGGLSMAWTAIDVALDPGLRERFLRA
ncbi:MAG: amidohydrolase, partial [Alphaproteobacteria bacterium]